MVTANHIEQWVCLVRVGWYEPANGAPFSFIEDDLHRMAKTIRLPMPIDVEWRADIGRDPVPLSGATIRQVEVRHDDHGAYLAALVRTLVVSFAARFHSRDPETGADLGPRVVGASFTSSPIMPTPWL